MFIVKICNTIVFHLFWNWKWHYNIKPFNFSSSPFLVVVIMCVVYFTVNLQSCEHKKKRWFYVISDVVNTFFICFVTFLFIVTFSQVYIQIKQDFFWCLSFIYSLKSLSKEINYAQYNLKMSELLFSHRVKVDCDQELSNTKKTKK